MAKLDPLLAAPDATGEPEMELTGTRVVEEGQFARDLMAALEQVIVGQRYMLERLLVGLLANGHVLLEGVPGIAKTLAVTTLAQALHARYQRIQFTPDLLPADLIGTLIYQPQSGEFRVRKGPVFANLLLADEINRAPAKVQSALLEAMQENQVTIGDESFALPQPFLVLATQNPIEHEGTYPLPEAQVDRFMLKLSITYPNRAEELEILERMARTAPIRPIAPVADTAQVLRARQVVDRIYLDDKVKRYIVDIVFATRRAARVRPRSRQLHRLRRVAAGLDLPGAGGQGPRLPPGPRLRHAPGRQVDRHGRAAPSHPDHLRGRGRGGHRRGSGRADLRAPAGSLSARPSRC